MQIQDKPASATKTEAPTVEVGTYSEQFYQDAQATFVVPKTPPRRPWHRAIASPIGVLFLSCLLMVALVSFSIGATATASSNGGAQTNGANSSSSSSSMTTSSSQSAPSNVPNATQEYGGQPATYVRDRDGAKHFTFTAEQVMWEVVKGQRVLAWTINGTVPGPTIRATVGDHVRITVINHFPKPTALHWHGLEVSSSQDGVPGIGMKPIQPGQTYTYDFTITNGGRAKMMTKMVTVQ